MVRLPHSRAKLQERAASDNPHLKREEWLRLAAKGSQLGLCYWNEETGHVFWDAKACEMFGVSIGEEIPLDTFYTCLHPDDRERVKNDWRSQLEQGLPLDLEFRAVRPDGTIIWIHALGNGYYDEHGKPLRMVGVVFDVTERKEAEQDLLKLAGSLINAQEEERRHLAREIHDDFNQRLAMLAVDLEQAEQMIQESAVREGLHKLSTQVVEIDADLHSLSHRLHSSTLERLGLTEGIRSFCRDFSVQQAIGVDFVHKDVPQSIHPDTALCLFRIVQEGLRNVSKHSRASRVDVLLEGSVDVIRLTLSDNGIGFDLSTSLASNGIGIRSMRERARMLRGTFQVLSRPSEGTRIMVTVPLHTTGTAA